MLTFCEECGNVMVLKEKKTRILGEYECRTCGVIKDMKVEKIEIKENNFEDDSTGIPDNLVFPFKI